MQRIWRIGSNWDGVNILPIFKKHNIAFAGSEVETHIERVKPNDIVAVTHGRKIEAVGRAAGLRNLRDVNPEYAEKFDDVYAIEIDPYFFSDECGLDLGIYDGTGKQFHEAHGEYVTFIKSLYNNAIKKTMDTKIINLLKYKHQIILQGPPGTGKTYTAKRIAQEMTKQQDLGSSESRIDGFFKSFDSSGAEVKSKRSELSNLINEFQLKFPKDQIVNLTLDKYCIGTGTNDSYCWWIERALKPLGYYFPGSSRAYLIYWNSEANEYRTHFKHSKILTEAKDPEEAMGILAGILSELILNKKSEEANKIFGGSFNLKILNSYYPDEFFPVNSVNCLNNILKLLGIDYSNLNLLEKNLKVQEIFNQKRLFFKADVTNLEFMRFLFDNFDLKGTISIMENTVFTIGEYKLIQFHPAYSYEDFVRGISAKTNEEGKVFYEVENKILAEFALKAEENPSANFVLIIDEINRANLPSVLGELIYAMEYRYDKEKPEETTVESMYALEEEGLEEINSKKLKLPGNLYIIGTMNTADRSVGHIDYAIRRRFAFVNILPKLIPELTPKGKELFLKVSQIFCKEFLETDNNLERTDFLAQDFNPTDVMPGHSYFLITDKDREKLKLPDEEILKLKLEYEIKPILREYLKDGILMQAADEIEKLYV